MIQENIARARKILYESETSAIYFNMPVNIIIIYVRLFHYSTDYGQELAGAKKH